MEDNKIVDVSLIHSVYLSHKNGANTVINLLLDNKDRFYKNGIKIKSVTPDENDYVIEKGGWRVKLKSFVVSTVKGFLVACSQKYDWAAKSIIMLKDQRVGRLMANKYLNQNPSDTEVAFFHTFFACYYYLKYRKVKQNVVLVLHSNGESFKMQRIYYKRLEKSSYYQMLLKMEQFVIDRVDRIVFVAQKPREIFLNNHPTLNPNKVLFVYNGVKDYTVIHNDKSKDEPLEICCVASITKRKGQCFIVDALAEMKKKPHVHFTFVGDGNDKEILEEKVRKNNLLDYVTFAGVTSNVDSFLTKSDIYILPSEDEGLPMAILEAMRASLPIVSTPVGGIPELLTDGYNGMMIQPSVEGVTNFLEKVEQTDWKEMGKNARILFEEKFTVEKMVDGYSKILTF